MCTAEVERAVRRDDPRARGSVCDGRIRVVDGDVLLRGSAADETSEQGGADDGVEDHGGTLQTADKVRARRARAIILVGEAFERLRNSTPPRGNCPL